MTGQLLRHWHLLPGSFGAQLATISDVAEATSDATVALQPKGPPPDATIPEDAVVLVASAAVGLLALTPERCIVRPQTEAWRGRWARQRQGKRQVVRRQHQAKLLSWGLCPTQALGPARSCHPAGRGRPTAASRSRPCRAVWPSGVGSRRGARPPPAAGWVRCVSTGWSRRLISFPSAAVITAATRSSSGVAVGAGRCVNPTNILSRSRNSKQSRRPLVALYAPKPLSSVTDSCRPAGWAFGWFVWAVRRDQPSWSSWRP